MAVTERARRELGTWPSPESLVEALAAALEVAADTETEPGREGERGASEPLRKASAVPRKTLQSPSFPLVSGATFLSLRACVSAQDLRPSSRATTARRSLRDALAELGVRNVNPADR